jgi:hypothetical protein
VVRTRFGWDRAAHEFVRLIEQHAGIAIEAPANGGPAATLSADG